MWFLQKTLMAMLLIEKGKINCTTYLLGTLVFNVEDLGTSNPSTNYVQYIWKYKYFYYILYLYIINILLYYLIYNILYIYISLSLGILSLHLERKRMREKDREKHRNRETYYPGATVRLRQNLYFRNSVSEKSKYKPI